MKTTIPIDFKVTDEHRDYCAEKWGQPRLADIFFTDFLECFLDNQRKHSNWNLTFKRYLRQNSPSGQFYQAEYWERMLNKAKQLEHGNRTRKEVYTVTGEPEQAAPSKPDYLSLLDKFRALRKGAGV